MTSIAGFRRRNRNVSEDRRRYGVADHLYLLPLTTGPGGPIATLAGRPLISNRGIPLNLDWVQQVRVNTSAVERRAQITCRAPHRKERVAGRMAAARRFLHGSDHAFGR